MYGNPLEKCGSLQMLRFGVLIAKCAGIYLRLRARILHWPSLYAVRSGGFFFGLAEALMLSAPCMSVNDSDTK